jgi:hypothetical protein
MTDDDFLTALGISVPLGEEVDLLYRALLEEALRIDDERSEYCQKLETRIAEQGAQIAELRRLMKTDAQD